MSGLAPSAGQTRRARPPSAKARPSSVGALLVSWGKSSFSEAYPDIWQYFFGALLVATVLLFPAGLVGTVKGWGSRLRERRAARRETPATASLELGVD